MSKNHFGNNGNMNSGFNGRNTDPIDMNSGFNGRNTDPIDQAQASGQGDTTSDKITAGGIGTIINSKPEETIEKKEIDITTFIGERAGSFGDNEAHDAIISEEIIINSET